MILADIIESNNVSYSSDTKPSTININVTYAKYSDGKMSASIDDKRYKADRRILQGKGFGWGDFPLLQESSLPDSVVAQMDVSVSSVLDVESRPSFESMDAVPTFADETRQYSEDDVDDDEEMKLGYSEDEEDDTAYNAHDSGAVHAGSYYIRSPPPAAMPVTNRKSNHWTNRKTVRFDHVQIREYSVTAGFHDWCEDGLALTLDWAYASTHKVISVDDYEATRRWEGRLQRGQLRKMDLQERRQRLVQLAGWTEGDVDAWHSKTHSTMQIDNDCQDECNRQLLRRSKTVTHFPLRNKGH